MRLAQLSRMKTELKTPPKPPFRLVHTPAQSAAIKESGIGFVTGQPSATERKTLLLFECNQHTARAAARVVRGTHRAAKIKTNVP